MRNLGKVAMRLSLGLAVLFVAAECFAAVPVGYGDGILHLGTDGYASIRDSEFKGFNSQGDFSLEVMLNIEANAAGGRWPVLLGKKNSPPHTDPGFCLTVNQGHFQTFGQQICAVISDGTNAVSATSRFYQGSVHAMMTWSASSRLLRLFINGNLERAVTNSLIDIAKLKNTKDFVLGGPSLYGVTLRRDVFLARLWNRVVDASEVASVWNGIQASGQPALPPSVAPRLLISEWLMESTCGTNGTPGFTHLKDSQGINHMELKGGAAVWSGEAELQHVYPQDGAVEVSKSTYLKVAGGVSSLGENVARPLKYEFQIDESSTFSSSALKSSGWLNHYGQWKPILKPSTLYYWRVRVCDSSQPPIVSEFSRVSEFTTKAPELWYVRPGVYTTFGGTGAPIPSAGIYGSQNGTSYGNAWNGIFSIKWGEGGVEPGDTVYVCGNHLYTIMNQEFVGTQGLVYLTESGFSDDIPITIRMDSPQEPGVMWGAARNLINGGGNWQGPDVNGVWRSSDSNYGADFLADGSNVLLLQRAFATTWLEPAGASFKTNGFTYVRTPDGSSPRGKVCSASGGYSFHLGRSSFIRFQNCRFYSGPLQMEVLGWDAGEDTQTSIQPSSHITYDRCEFRFHSPISPCSGNDFWTISNSEFSDGAYGVYTFLNRRSRGASFLTIRSNYFHDLGTSRFDHKDAHAIGIQGGDNHIIEGNRIENTGAAIEFWTGAAPMCNHTVRYNLIKNIHVKSVTGGGGIVVSGDNATATEGKRTGFRIYGNIIMNTGIGGTDDWQGPGIKSNTPDFIEISNNTIYNPNRGISVGVMGAVAKARIVNNIIVHPRDRYIQLSGEQGVSADSVVDYNLFFPAAKGVAEFGIYAIQHDLNSVYADPGFVSTNPSSAADFRLRYDSKARKAGIDVGLDRDFAGTPIPAGVAPDIGAFQYVPTSLRPTPPTNLKTNR